MKGEEGDWKREIGGGKEGGNLHLDCRATLVRGEKSRAEGSRGAVFIDIR